jgi:hypothetical protein
LANLTVDHGEAANAAAAIERLLRRLGADAERLTERAEPYYVPPTRQRRARRKSAAEKAHQEKLHVGSVIDLHRWCRCGRGHGRFEVLSAIELGHYGMLRCVGCGKNAMWLTRAHFEAGGRYLMDLAI